MLKITKKASMAMFSLLLSFQSNAAFVSTDWKTDGDKLATLDTDTGLEWLDLTQTAFKSINEVKSLLSTVYAGWRLPTYAEMVTLSVNLYSPQIVSNLGQPNGSSVAYGSEGGEHALWGFAHPWVGGYSYGTYELNGQTMMFGRSAPSGVMHFNYDRVANKYRDTVNAYSGVGLDHKHIHDGVYLVSDGGTTLSSLNDPTLNSNNPNAPVNNQPSPVNGPVLMFAFSLLYLLVNKRTVKS